MQDRRMWTIVANQLRDIIFIKLFGGFISHVHRICGDEAFKHWHPVAHFNSLLGFDQRSELLWVTGKYQIRMYLIFSWTQSFETERRNFVNKIGMETNQNRVEPTCNSDDCLCFSRTTGFVDENMREMFWIDFALWQPTSRC